MTIKKHHINSQIIQKKVDEARSFFNSLRDEKDYDLDVIKSKLQELIVASGYSKPYFYHYFLTDGLYRARKHQKDETLFCSTKDFWYRDWSKVDSNDWRYDRLNMPGQNVWYFSNRIKACIAETRPIQGDIISLANIKQFQHPRKFNYFLHLGSASLDESDANLRKMHNDSQKSKKRSKTDELIESFIDDICLQKVSDIEKFKYIPSIALKEILKSSNSKIKTDGIVYPSIALGHEAVNIALLNPKSDESNFFVYQTIMFEVTESKKDKYYKVIPLLVGKNLNQTVFEDLPICWQNPRPEEIKEYSYTINLKSTSSTL